MSTANGSPAFAVFYALPLRLQLFLGGLGQYRDVLAEAGHSVQRMPPAQHPKAGSFGWVRSWFAILFRMDVERIIDDIEQLEEMFEAPDIRPLSASDVSAANRRHDETLANSPWFRIWKDFGICCRPENPMLSETERQ